MDASLRPLFEPFRIRRVTFRNRFVSTSHAPGYAVGGNIPQRYVDYESEKAKGGVGLIQFGGATAVSVKNSFTTAPTVGGSRKSPDGWTATLRAARSL
jgi:2,4-dienoyl-CoA reductase-like NADH-dependent reductase (Old Yellow Enzyme family)